MKLHFVSTILLFSVLLEHSIAGRIVLVPTITFDSHLYVFKQIAIALNDQGHEVVLVLSEGRQIEQSSQFQVQQYHGIFNSKTADEFLQEKMNNIFAGKLTSLELFTILEKYVANCDLMTGNAELIHQLKAQNFDLLLIDPNEMCGYILAHMLGVKYAVVSTGLWFPPEIGAPAPVAYVPEFNSLLTDRMTFMGRAWNTVVYIISRVATHFVILPKFEAIIRKHADIPQISMMELIHGTSLFFLCNDFALEFSRPLLPNVVFVGGILTAPAKPLSEDLLPWVEGGKTGLVVVSFGIGIRHLPEDLAEKMAAAFSRLPQRVIWRYFGQKPRNLGNNTRILEWLPQNDLLGHPSTKVFVSHCGLNGIFESIYNGVPVVGIPFYGDQYDIMTRIQANGMGILMNWNHMTEEDLYQALSTVITNPRYKETAAYISGLHRDQPQHALNRTVYWVDYLLRYDGVKHLRPASFDIPFYQYYLLDVLALFGLLTALIIYLAYRIILNIKKPPQRRYQNGYMNGYCHNGYLATEIKKFK